jgi:hypothetical protein
LRAEIPTAHLSKLVRAIRQANFWYLRLGRVDVMPAGKCGWLQMILLFLIMRCTPTIRELIEATLLSLSSQSATSLSALAPAQRAIAQRFRALCRFSAAGMQVYPRAEAAGGRKAPRHEVAGGWALAGQRALWGFVRDARLRKFEERRLRMRAQLKRFGTIVAKEGI